MLMCAGENHISIVPDCFLQLPGQAEIHMYSYGVMSVLAEFSCDHSRAWAYSAPYFPV
jgi:hypothetical protein